MTEVMELVKTSDEGVEYVEYVDAPEATLAPADAEVEYYQDAELVGTEADPVTV